MMNHLKPINDLLGNQCNVIFTFKKKDLYPFRPFQATRTQIRISADHEKTQEERNENKIKLHSTKKSLEDIFFVRIRNYLPSLIAE